MEMDNRTGVFLNYIYIYIYTLYTLKEKFQHLPVHCPLVDYRLLDYRVIDCWKWYDI